MLVGKGEGEKGRGRERQKSRGGLHASGAVTSVGLCN